MTELETAITHWREVAATLEMDEPFDATMQATGAELRLLLQAAEQVVLVGVLK